MAPPLLKLFIITFSVSMPPQQRVATSWQGIGHRVAHFIDRSTGTCHVLFVNTRECELGADLGADLSVGKVLHFKL